MLTAVELAHIVEQSHPDDTDLVQRKFPFTVLYGLLTPKKSHIPQNKLESIKAHIITLAHTKTREEFFKQLIVFENYIMSLDAQTQHHIFSQIVSQIFENAKK